MTHRERFGRLLRFQPVDRLPVLEWAPWWDQTLDRWRTEGLPETLTDQVDVQRHLGLDPIRHVWLASVGPDAPKPEAHGAGILKDEADYGRLLPALYPTELDADALRRWAAEQERGALVVWITFDGFFWFPRKLLGIQRHLYAFYDQPDLMHRINTDLLAHMHRLLDRVLPILTPDFMTFAEDMSYNHGPMIGREPFERFMAPYYRRITPRLREAGVPIFIDSDGDVTELVPWLTGVGAQGFLPLERMAGVDVAALRRRHRRLRMIGAYDKTVMHRGEAAIRAEFERLLPVAAQGGFAVSVDHQTPPGVSLSQYRQYLAIFREYAHRAAERMHPS
jgi:hypothetical protein